jgi:hypothetical protein
MGVHVIRRVRDLGQALILAPERFDPRRNIEVESARCLSGVAEIVTETVAVGALPVESRVLVLDTTQAFEGFVVLRHEPVAAGQMGSTKRRLRPGDVIISRLRPYLRQVAFIDQDLFQLAPGGNEVVASTEFYVLRGKDGFEVAALVPFLLSSSVQAALAAGQEGGHHPRFPKELLAALRVPDGVVSGAPALAERVRALAAAVRQALRGSRELVAALEELFTDCLE